MEKIAEPELSNLKYQADRTMHYKEVKKQFIKESLKENLQYGF